jgi:hypothetical protein
MAEYQVISHTVALSFLVIISSGLPALPLRPFDQQPFLPPAPLRFNDRDFPRWTRFSKRHHYRQPRPGRRN